MNSLPSFVFCMFLKRQYSFFQRSYCTKLSAVIHELGHSIFGFLHSSKDGEEYADISCYMGFLEDSFAYPLKAFVREDAACSTVFLLLHGPLTFYDFFDALIPYTYQNAHKHWLSGWFDDRAETVNRTELPRDGYDRRLVSFVDYNHDALMETDVVLIAIDDLYMQYDIPKGYNIDSLSRANVLITQANDTMSRSFAVANLSMGQSFTYRKISDSDDSNEIVIEFCNTGFANDTLDYSIISIHLNDGTQQSTCQHAENGTLSSTPTSPILSMESSAPSSPSSSVPSDVPTNIPSMPNRNSVTSSRPTPLPNNITTYIPAPVRKTLIPSAVRSTTLGPVGNDNSSGPETSGAYNGSGRILLRLSRTMELSTIPLVVTIALQYFLSWMIVQM